MAPQYGSRLMVSVVDDEAQNNPERVFAWIPRTSDVQDGFRAVTFLQIKNAVDYTVHWLKDAFGEFSLHETLCYVGVSDLRYNILIYAALKLRLKVFLPSPRNPPSTNASLLSQTQCTKLVHSPEVAPVIKALQGTVSSPHCQQFPALEELLNAQPAEPVPYTLDFHQVKREPIVILHSSGSTGLPKPITMTHGSFAILDNDRNFPSVPGRRNHDLTTWDFPPGSCLYVPFPLFHLAGFFNNVMLPVYTQTVPVFGPPTRLPSGALTAHIIQSLNVKGCFLPPSLVADLYSEPNGVELLKSLDVLCYAGGPLAESIGNELVQHVTLCQFYGSTELGLVRQLMPPKEHWQYMEFHPLSRIELQPADDDAYELVVFADEETESHSGLNHNLPGVREFRTKDLFRRHPTQPNLWKFHARRDDIVILSNGEKFNPIPLELGVEALFGVMGAVVAGQGQPRVALLVELRPDHGLGGDPIENLWPSIAKLNTETAAQGRVSKSMILIASRDKPFVRAGKGTVVRKLTINAYQAELDALFKGFLHEQRVQPQKKLVLKPTAFHLTNVQNVVHSIIQDALDGQDIDDSADLYSQGLDSVKTLETISQLKASLEGQGQGLTWLKPEIIYTYPSVQELSAVLLQWLNEGTYPKQVDRVTKMKELLTRYENSLPAVSASLQLPQSQDDPLSVVIIGSTGYLGQYLLSSLVHDVNVGRIICLNRSPTARERWATHLSTNEGITNTDGKWLEKVSFFQVDFTKPEFGLEEKVYNEVKESCDIIVHSAWQVNFVAPLDAFGDSFSGLVNSIKLAAFSKRRARLVYVSSIAATGIWGLPGSEPKLVPEAVVKHANEAMRNGYGESKHVAEHLIHAAGTKSGVAASILRVGQIAPTSVPATSSSTHKITWPANDAFTVLLKACRIFQIVPTDLLGADWLPVNAVVDLTRRILQHDRSLAGESSPRFYNVVNPVSTAWAELAPTIQSWCGSSTTLTSLKEWIESIKSRSHDESKYNDASILPLLDFFDMQVDRGSAHGYSQENVMKIIDRTIDIRPIDQAQLAIWLAALRVRGALTSPTDF